MYLATDLLPVCHFDAQVRPCLCAAGLTVHAEAQSSPTPIDATLLVDIMSIRISSTSNNSVKRAEFAFTVM